MKKLSITILALLTLAVAVYAQDGHEYAPLEEKTVNYKNWTLPHVTSDEPQDLRTLMKGKKLVMVVYFAPWCRNWRFEMPVALKLYEKYKNQGFQVIGVSEYAPRTEVYSHFGAAGAPFPIYSESESRQDKETTHHYTYRQLTGDTRTWGSPWNIFLEPDKVKPTGDILKEKAWVVNGELVEEEVDKFIALKVQASSTDKTDPKKTDPK